MSLILCAADCLVCSVDACRALHCTEFSDRSREMGQTLLSRLDLFYFWVLTGSVLADALSCLFYFWVFSCIFISSNVQWCRLGCEPGSTVVIERGGFFPLDK